MDVVPGLEGAFQLGDIGDMGRQAQFDLAVIGRQQQVTRFGDKGMADLAPFLGAHRDILDIGLG